MTGKRLLPPPQPSPPLPSPPPPVQLGCKTPYLADFGSRRRHRFLFLQRAVTSATVLLFPHSTRLAQGAGCPIRPTRVIGTPDPCKAQTPMPWAWGQG